MPPSDYLADCSLVRLVISNMELVDYSLGHAAGLGAYPLTYPTRGIPPSIFVYVGIEQLAVFRARVRVVTWWIGYTSGLIDLSREW